MVNTNQRGGESYHRTKKKIRGQGIHKKRKWTLRDNLRYHELQGARKTYQEKTNKERDSALSLQHTLPRADKLKSKGELEY